MMLLKSSPQNQLQTGMLSCRLLTDVVFSVFGIAKLVYKVLD